MVRNRRYEQLADAKSVQILIDAHQVEKHTSNQHHQENIEDPEQRYVKDSKG